VSRRISVNLEVTVEIEVPDHWVSVGELANETAIEEDALGAIQEGEPVAAVRMQSWSFNGRMSHEQRMMRR
jgi:hypothetical protein